ncbi:DUF211 domain-containing protein [Thiomicrorhabdus sp. ZW0627]|uniref:DUF211 domain-containing protein n=1 Tax=Thiomicrorhabdus sp. ZW0627 TaxID=3039774 RepID=UPI00243691FD|nr:DUF211 domain-containing protein [Thiomicrorhabdus sp. ZW0627]MDG6772785.1 DUF211 domain-containing protein [Thiomicrorhabdus sp. ZW0627]
MATIRRLVLDVLKPHQPNAIAFASTLADLSPDYWVNLDVTEVDEKTETTVITIEGNDIHFEDLSAAIEKMGGSIHSIDEVEVIGSEQA